MVKAQTKKATAALNRGAWTPEEDKKLVECVRLHGDHKWRTIPEKAGLKRCGKSCRLRWLNYLSPNIKRGNITKDEEELIIRLHNLLGNKWSLIAGRLPGRTDNEIKNYWNAHLSSRALSTNDLNRKLFINSNFSCQPLQVNDTAAVASTLARPLPVRLAPRQKSPNRCTASVAAIMARENDITLPASATLAVGGSGLISATMQLSTPELIDSHHAFNGMAQLIDAHEALDRMAQPLDLADHTNRQIGAGGDGAAEALEKDGKGVLSLDGLDMWLSGWEFDDMDNIIGCELGDELALGLSYSM